MRISVRIAAAYAALSVAWIGGSDALLASAFPADFPSISIYKGWGFVAITALALYALLEREMKKRDAVEAALRRFAAFDPLTGLLNRSVFVDNLGRAVAQAERRRAEMGLIFLDLDGFKDINDQHGHRLGDEVLSAAAERLRETVRGSDSLARFGGDEFLVLVADGRDGTASLAVRLVEAIRQPFQVRGRTLSLTASVGYALFPEHGRHGEQLLHAADSAMYRAKELGKNTVVEAVYEPSPA